MMSLIMNWQFDLSEQIFNLRTYMHRPLTAIIKQKICTFCCTAGLSCIILNDSINKIIKVIDYNLQSSNSGQPLFTKSANYNSAV